MQVVRLRGWIKKWEGLLQRWIGATILNTIIVVVCQQLKQAGIDYHAHLFIPQIWDSGDELNQSLFEQHAWEAIHYQL